MDEDRHNMADMTFAEHVNFSQTTSIIITHKHTHIYTRLNNTHICQTHFKMTRGRVGVHSIKEEGGGKQDIVTHALSNELDIRVDFIYNSQ